MTTRRAMYSMASRILLVAALHTPHLGGQQPAASAPHPVDDAATTISVSARLVNLPVVVRDHKGSLIQSLTRADFLLIVDGRPQPIRYFDRDNDLPLTLGLLVDTSGSVRARLEEERAASSTFLDQMLTTPANHAPDKAFVIQFAREVELLKSLTSSRPKLQEALTEIGTPPKDEQSDAQADAPNDTQNNPQNNNGAQRGRGRGHVGGTTLYDAVFLGSDEVMQKQQGRKALIILSDGEDRGSRETLDNCIAASLRAETVVYAIYFKGEEHGGGFPGGGFPGGGRGGFPGGGGGFPGGGGGRRSGGAGEPHVDGKKVLERITSETGGRLFEVSGKQSVSAIYTQIAEELRGEYRLGYTPDAAAAAAGYHQVDLTIPKQKKLVVQTRAGYFGKE